MTLQLNNAIKYSPIKPYLFSYLRLYSYMFRILEAILKLNIKDVVNGRDLFYIVIK